MQRSLLKPSNEVNQRVIDLISLELESCTRSKTELFENNSERAESGKTRLEEIRADKCGEPQPIYRVKEGACLNTECETQQNHETSKNKN